MLVAYVLKNAALWQQRQCLEHHPRVETPAPLSLQQPQLAEAMVAARTLGAEVRKGLLAQAMGVAAEQLGALQTSNGIRQYHHSIAILSRHVSANRTTGSGQGSM